MRTTSPLTISIGRPCWRQLIELLAQRRQLRQIPLVCSHSQRLLPQRAASPATGTRLAQSAAHSLRVAHPLSPQDSQGSFRILVQADMQGTCHTFIVLQIILQAEGSLNRGGSYRGILDR